MHAHTRAYGARRYTDAHAEAPPHPDAKTRTHVTSLFCGSVHRQAPGLTERNGSQWSRWGSSCR
eukprot:4980381-Pleurochrysis_carterae.AAC.1